MPEPGVQRELSVPEKAAAGATKSGARSWAQVREGSPRPGGGDASPNRGLWMAVALIMELKIHWDRDTTPALGSIWASHGGQHADQGEGWGG